MSRSGWINGPLRQTVDTLRHWLEECGAKFTRAPHEPDGGLRRAYHPGIVEIGCGFRERVALLFVEVSEKYLSTRPHDRALTGAAESPGLDARPRRACQNAKHHHVPRLVLLEDGHMDRAKFGCRHGTTVLQVWAGNFAAV